MRCTKCGYDGAGNIPGGTCIKCGTRLIQNGSALVSGVNQSELSDAQSRPTMIGMNNVLENQNLRATRIVGAPEPKSPLKQTVVQGAVLEIGGQMKSTVVQGVNSSPAPKHLPLNDSDELVCPECGYPLAGEYSSCPNCGADFSGESEEESAEKQNVPSKESQHAESTPSSKVSKRNCKNKKNTEDDLAVQGTIGLSALKKEEVESDEDILCTCEKCGEEISATFQFCPKCGTEVRQRTLQGLRHKKKDETEEVPKPTIKSEFLLTIIPEEDEDITTEAIHFEGAEVMLNRKNTEPSNRTITSKEQAVVFSENGRWYIENRSEYDSTLILAKRKMEIQDGDIIMLGDRRFKFESKESGLK